MLEKAKRSLCEMQDSDALFKLLDINVIKSTQSITGAVKVKVKVKQKTSALIYGDVPAVVDGSIRILILNEDQGTLKYGEKMQGTLKYGEGILVLPLNGTSKVCQSEVICTNSRGYTIPEKHSVMVVPNKLWAIEKI